VNPSLKENRRLRAGPPADTGGASRGAPGAYDEGVSGYPPAAAHAPPRRLGDGIMVRMRGRLFWFNGVANGAGGKGPVAVELSDVD
jgi:hypothetical protein